VPQRRQVESGHVSFCEIVRYGRVALPGS
jgi:hypothetical protein